MGAPYNWYTVEEARTDWLGAPMDDARLQQVLDVAQSECLTYAPLPDYDPAVGIPAGHREAHLKHAEDIWNSAKVNPAGAFGDDTLGYAITPFPMDRSTKQRLRPRKLFGGEVG